MAGSGYVSEELTVVWLLLIAVVVATYFIQAYRVTLLPPSSSALLLGVAFGIASRIAGLSQPLRFSPAAFFYALLPPIVFAAGFTLKKRAFFDNIGAILTYAVLGTLASTLAFAFGTYFLVLIGIVRRSHMGGSPFVECLMYGAAISSIDPVATLAVLASADTPPVLYNLVFGESVLNDAVAIVLFRSLATYSQTHAGVGLMTLPAVALRFCVLAAGSLGVGLGVALACAFLLKRFEAYYARPGGGAASWHGRNPAAAAGSPSSSPPPPHALDPTIYEIAIVVMGSYLAYLVAEVAGTSGIVALFFSGIVHAHYSNYNVSSDARIALRRLFEVGAFLCELFVFAYLGLQVATSNHAFDFGLFFSGIPLAVASRAANVFPCSKIVNTYRTRKLPRRLQRMLWAVGLRGAVAYGLVVNMPNSNAKSSTDPHTPSVGIPAIETAALLIVVASTLVLGSATGPLLRHLDLEGRSDEEIYAEGWAEEGPIGQPAPPVGIRTGSTIHDKFKEIDESVLKPLFGGRQGGDSGGIGRGEDGFYDDNDEESGGGAGRGFGLAAVAGEGAEEFGGDGPTLRRPLFGPGDEEASGKPRPPQQRSYPDYFAGNGSGDGGGGDSGGLAPAGPSAGSGGGSGGTPIPAAHHHLGGEGGASSPPAQQQQMLSPAPAAAATPAGAAGVPTTPVPDAIVFGDED